MKLEEFNRQKTKNFVISWTVIYFLFGLMVTWSLIVGYEAQKQYPEGVVSIFWPHTFLMFFVLFSLLAGIIGMWKTFLSGRFDRVRRARNISFITVLFLYPLGVIINFIMANLN